MSQTQSQNRFEVRVRKRTRGLGYWTGAWLVSTAIFAFGPRFIWNEAIPITLLAFAICLLVGVGMVISNKNYTRELDELHQKVTLDAMGITLGVAIIVGLPYVQLDSYGLAPFEPKIVQLMVLMSITFMTCIFLGLKRYR